MCDNYTRHTPDTAESNTFTDNNEPRPIAYKDIECSSKLLSIRMWLRSEILTKLINESFPFSHKIVLKLITHGYNN